MKIELAEVVFHPRPGKGGTRDFVTAVKKHSEGCPGMGFVLDNRGLVVVFPNLVVRCELDIDDASTARNFIASAREELVALGFPVLCGYFERPR